MWGLIVAALCIALNGFFVAAEFALVKVRATSLRSRARKGERKARIAEAIVSRLDRYLSVTQFGITLASLGLGWIGEPAAAHLVERAVSGFGRYIPQRVLEIGVVVIAFGALTYAQHPEGVLEYQKRRSTMRFERLFFAREAEAEERKERAMSASGANG